MKSKILASLYIVSTVVGLSLVGQARAAEKQLVNADKSGVALHGYDAVSYFAGQPMAGKPEHASSIGGAKYLFASAEHKAMFDKEPAKYMPQYGGYCAFGVAKGKLFDIDPKTGQVIGGKLYVNLNAQVLADFNKDTAGYIRTADGNWPGLVKANGK